MDSQSSVPATVREFAKQRNRLVRVLFLWGDERNVPADHADSNYRMAREALLDHLPISADQVLPIPTDGGDAYQAATAYEQTLRARLSNQFNDFGVIDCVLLGIGDDAHTASLFPQTDALKENQRWVVANYVAKLATWRVTLTVPLINSAKSIAFFIAGASKTAALQTLWHGPVNHELYPSQMIRPVDGDLTFFVDQAAVNGLTIPSEFEIVK
ncbi:MAG: 6-phosphogluconolactonase [Pirellulales bacterium]